MAFYYNITIHKLVCSPSYSTNYQPFFLAGLGGGGEGEGGWKPFLTYGHMFNINPSCFETIT